jgi:hypothetical protein
LGKWIDNFLKFLIKFTDVQGYVVLPTVRAGKFLIGWSGKDILNLPSRYFALNLAVLAGQLKRLVWGIVLSYVEG